MQSLLKISGMDFRFDNISGLIKNGNLALQ